MPVTLHRISRRRIAVAAIAALMAACGGGGDETETEASTLRVSAAGAPSTNPAFQDKALIVQIRPDLLKISDVERAVRGRVISQLGTRPIYLIEVSDLEAAQLALDSRLTPEQRKGRVYAEPNRKVWAIADDGVGAIKNSVMAIGKLGGELAPAWAEEALQVKKVWATGQRGAGVMVAVLDTGVDPEHEYFKDRLVRNHGYDFVDSDEDPSERSLVDNPNLEEARESAWGHGTHVAGVIATLAPEAKILPVRVLDPKGEGTYWSVTQGIEWALDQGAAILNLSFGTTDPSKTLLGAVARAGCVKDFAYAKGFERDADRCDSGRKAAIFAGAGNGYRQHEGPLYPAAFEGVDGLRSVTATRFRGGIAAFAERGAEVDLAAPGDYITSAFPNGDRATMSGTSMATPWAAATAALLMSAAPACDRDAVLRRIADTGTPVLDSERIRMIAPLAAVRSGRSTTGCRW